MLIKRLQDHIDGKVEMSQTQTMAAKTLLDRTLPALSAIEYTQAEEIPEENQLLDRIFSILTSHPDLARAMVGRLQQALGSPIQAIAAPLPAAEQPTGDQEAA
jgi:hypothetical protein